MPCIAEKAFQETSHLLAPLLGPEACAALSCAASGCAGPANAFEWPGECEAEFGAVCRQYLRYLELINSSPCPSDTKCWRLLYLKLRSFHRSLGRGCFLENLHWRRAASIQFEGKPRLLQGGHAVVFSGDDEGVAILQIADRGPTEQHGLFRPADFLDVVPISPWEVVGICKTLELERWRFDPVLGCPGDGNETGHEKGRLIGVLCCRVPSKIGEHGDALEGLRIFVEHVANRLFVIAGCYIYAFDLTSLDQLYVLIVPIDAQNDASRCGDHEILARWDYGRAFLAHQAEGMRVMMWSTTDGASRGHIRSDCELLCCDISHNDLCEILVTLEIDGEIRLFKNLLAGDGTERVETFTDSWEFVTNISLKEPVVEVKVERFLLLAVSHSENGERGAIHLWELLPQHFADKFLLPHRRCLQCAYPPDRVEARHGGRFIEAFFIPGSSPHSRPPDGIYDIEWFDVTMKSLLKLRGIGDWRCDLRDTVARLEDDMSVSWLPLWHPVFRTCSKWASF